MFSTFIGLIDIQSWWEVPCIAHFCSLFSSAFQLPDFDIEDLEEALLTNADTESEVDLKVYSTRLLPDLIVALLKGCDALSQIVSHISPSNYQMFLRRLFRQKCQEYNIDNPFNEDTDFEKLPLRTKILILKYLCDFRLDSADVFNSFANLEADSLRVEPLGFDSKGSAYWYFFGTRLYREDYEVSTGKGNKSSNKRSVWQVICFTEEDWRNLAGKFKRSKNESDRALLEQLEENFLPNIPKIFRDKERERRNKLLERRTSSRIKTFEERRLADIYRQKEIEEAQKALLKEHRKLAGKSEPQPEDNRSQRVKLAEDRARRAERRSRSNSVSSIVSTYASSPEPLTSDFIFQPKESENLAYSKHSSSGAKHTATVVVSNPPASPSSELGSEPTTSADIAVYSGGSKQNPEEVFEEDNENSENDDDDDEEEEDSASLIVVDQVNNNFTEVGSSVSVASGTTTTSSGISSREQREKTPSASPTPPPVEAPSHPEPAKRRSKLSAEIEALLQYNRNMAPTTTKLPGRQTNNSLSSVTGPVILPFADTPPPPKTSGSKSAESTTVAVGSGGGGGGAVGSATATGGRKKKSKASEVFTETEEVLQIGMHKVLEYIKNHDDAWPFMDPVDEDIAPRYYSIIRRPMDLQKMEEKLDNGEYLTFGDFRNDFKLIVNNCRLYNGQANEYTEMVNNLQLAFEKATKKYFDSNSSDEEQTLEYPIFKEKPFGSSGGKNINESTGGSTSANNSKSSSENKSDNSKKSSAVKNNNSDKDAKSDKDVKSDKKEGKVKNSNKKGSTEIGESSSVGKKQNSETGGNAKKGKASGEVEPKGGKNDNAKGLKRKRKEKDKVGKGKSKKFKPNESDEDGESEEGEDENGEEDVKDLKEHTDTEEEIRRSPTPVPPEIKNKVNSKVKKKEEKVKEKTKNAKGKKEDRKLAKSEVGKKGRKKSPSRSRSVSRSRSASPVPRSPSPPKNVKGKKEDKKLAKNEVGKKGRKKSPPRSRSRSVSRSRSASPMSKSPSPPPASSSKKAEKRKETTKQKHGKKERKEDRPADREMRNAEKKILKQADTSMNSGTPSPVKGRGRKKAQEKKAENQSDAEEHVDPPIEEDEDKETDLSNFADIDEIRVRNDSRGYASEESVEDLPASDDGKKSKKNKKGGQKTGKTKGKNKSEEKSKKNKSKGKSGKSKKSKSNKSFDTSSLISSSNEEEAIEEAPTEQKSKSKPAEKEIKSASKKQPKDFSKYTTLPRDRSSSRSFSRSPSPLPSIRDRYSSMSDHSMDFDDDDDLNGGRKSAPARPITPDIRDKYDLIKERRRNQQKASSQTGAPVTTPTNEKPTKQKHKPQETSRKKQKPNQTQTTSSSASPNPSKQQKVTEESDNSTKTKETGKSKRKRDRSSECNRDSPVPEEIKDWTPPEPLPTVEKPRPSYKDEKTEKRESERKVDPSDEYDFVDDSPPEIPTPKAPTPIPSPVEKLPKPPKVKTESSKKQMQKSMKSSQQHASLKPITAPANRQPKTTGANMEALELETEQTLKDINKWLENTPRFSEYSSASNSPSRYIMDDLDAVTAKIDVADFRKPIPLSQLPEEETESPIIPIAQAVVVPPSLTTLPTPIPSLPTSPKAMIPPALPTPKEPSKPKQPKEQPQDINPLKESVNNVNISASHPVVAKPHPPQPPVASVPPAPNSAAIPPERPHLGPPQIIPPHSQKKEPKEPKRKTLKEKLSQLGSRKRDTVHRLDRLQPGKSKGNLLGSMQNINKPEELFPLGGGPNKLKEVKNSLIVKTDESKPKLSLGTVLNTEGFGLGQQHNFADEKKENVGDVAEDKVVKEKSDSDQSLNSSKDDSGNAAKLLIQEDIKAAKAELAKTDPGKVVISPEKATKAVNKSDKPSATPNLSAWFKAFGAPKKPKKPEDGEEGASKNSPPESGKGGENTSPSDSGLNVPLVPSLESPSYPSLPAPRQRKASTGSTVSERSSFSQDPDSPRIGIDERIGVYPAPYPSPIGASPIMTSPKLDDTQKSPYPLNGAIKVGFYQDTTTKSSPEKSCSPRDLPSPYPQYSQHLYSSNSGMTANNLYGNYAYSGNTNATSTANATPENFKSFDQYKQPASQESDYNSSMSPSTNPNSPYHNQQSSPYQQQPNSPYQQQQPNQNFNQQQQPIASPASSGPLSPYSTNSIAPPPSVQQSPAQSVSGHSPFNPSPTSPYQTPQHQPQSQPPQVQKPNQQSQQQQPQPQPQQHPSKPNTPIHQSPNSPFSQSNHSSPYSQQDPNSPYSQGQLSPFQPMSPKPSQSSLPVVPQGTTNNSLKLAPPIITPQQAAAAAGVTLPDSPVNNLSQQSQQTSPQQQPPQVQNTGSQLPIPQPQPQLPPQLNTQTPWNQQPPTYNQYGTPTDNSIGMGSNLPAPAHMHHHQQQAQSQPQQQQKPQPAHHNVQHMQPQLLSQQQQQQPSQLQQQQPPPSCQQQSQQQHPTPNLSNLTPAHSQSSIQQQQQQQQQQQPQQQHSHLSNLLTNNPYASNYGRQAYDPTGQSSHVGQDVSKSAAPKVPELINLGYNSGSNESSASSNKPQSQPHQQEIPMNMGNKQPAADTTKEKELTKQQQMFELMGAIGYTNPMDISISKTKAFDMFNRAATMTFPRGFPGASNSGTSSGSLTQQQEVSKMGYGGNTTGYDQMQANTNKAHDMSGATAYNMQQPHQQQPKTNQSDLIAGGNIRGNVAAGSYDQRTAANVQQQQQQLTQQQQQANMDLSAGYKSFSGASSSSLMDPALRNLASLSSLYQSDATSGFYDKNIPPAAHMFGKNLSNHPVGASSVASSTTSTLQQMFNSSMATTMAYNAAARDQQTAYGANYHQRSDLLNQGQKVPLNIPTVANPTAATAVVPEPTKPKRSRKKKDATQDMMQQQLQHQQQAHQHQQTQPNAAHQGFQAYPGHKTSQSSSQPISASNAPGNVGSNSSANAEPSAISLKTANVVPGSAFNFGTGPAGLGLPSSLYGENSPYLDEFRNNPNPYPYLASSHRGSTAPGAVASADGSDKSLNPSASTASAVAAVAAAAAAVHQPPPAASPYHQFLSHPSSRAPYQFMNQLDPLHQQYIRQEELRAQMMLNQSLGLGAPGAHGPPPGAYGQPGAYHHALGMHKPYDAMNSMNRPPWL